MWWCDGGSNIYRPAMTRLVVQIKNKSQSRKIKAQWESRVIIISNRIRHVSFGASAYNQQHSFARKAQQQKTIAILASHGSHTQSHETSIGGDLDTDPALRFRIGGSSESHDRACFRAGDPPTLALALDDACGDPESSRSRSSHAYAGRIGGMSPDEGGGRAWVECGAYRIGSESYVDNLRGYAETPSGPPSVHTHPGKGQCALCGRWF